jgi:hypothetical protein
MIISSGPEKALRGRNVGFWNREKRKEAGCKPGLQPTKPVSGCQTDIGAAQGSTAF